MENKNTIFQNGSAWLRADFHLHTKTERPFKYSGTQFAKDYIKQLIDQQIRIGVITNHNKFDLEEFKQLHSEAEKHEIYLLPGVEFSCKDGRTGIHLLIVFDHSWIKEENFIERFLIQAFSNITGYDRPNYPNSNFNLSETVNCLNQYGKDYFIIAAHADDDNGLFKELKGRNLESWVKSEAFNKVLGLQKAWYQENVKKIESLLVNSNRSIALVEGTDSAHLGISGIGVCNKKNGVTQKTFLKIGAYNFDALKFALIDKEYRVASKLPETKNGYIKSITFQGGKLGGTTINLNHAMNNLIGIRGSGKSSILESIRYALDIELTKQNVDREYKTNLVNHALGSGGKIILQVVDDQNNNYRIEKILGESANVYKENELQHNLAAKAIVQKPIYYGQKDLSQIGDSVSTEYLLNRLIGDQLAEHRRKIESKSQEIVNIFSDLKKIEKNLSQKPDIEAKKAELELNIKKFKDLEIDKKLEAQIGYNKDANHIKRMGEYEERVLESIDELIEEYKDGFDTLIKYESKENPQLFKRLYDSFQSFQKLFGQIEDISKKLYSEHKTFKGLDEEFQKKYEALKEKFAEIKREIKLPNIHADDYIKFTKNLDLTNARLKEIDKLSTKRDAKTRQLNGALVQLKDLWLEEYNIIKDEVSKVNTNQEAIEIKTKFKGNKEAFKKFLQEKMRGSGLQGKKLETIADEYNDLVELYYDLENDNGKLAEILSGGNQLLSFREYFQSQLPDLLIYRVPDHFDIIYHERPLTQHSLGQRASALIIFLLTIKDSHLIIVDQPEDDLDNQTIYEDVIKVLKDLKNNTQFIFATHNPNIPVLGDCEQIISCRYSSDQIAVNQGSIDNEEMRDEVIEIMEGGYEAFDERKKRYELWKH